jgi:hypothetical protein
MRSNGAGERVRPELAKKGGGNEERGRHREQKSKHKRL